MLDKVKSDQRTYLKVKIKNLADEARTIRKEENKKHGMQKWQLQYHRKTVVRDAARRTQIAYQIIRDRDWQSCASELTMIRDFKEIERMVNKYGNSDSISRLPLLKDFI